VRRAFPHHAPRPARPAPRRLLGEPAQAALKRLGLIGSGRIGGALVQASLPGWEIARVLTRSRPCPDFFEQSFDLVVEAAGPQALREHGARALAIADVWTVSGAALADDSLFRTLQDAGRSSGHRLRVVAGAIAGLDGVSAAGVDPSMELKLQIDLPPGSSPASFKGTVRQAAKRFPDSVNVAVAAALAGPGLDRAQIEVRDATGPRHRLALSAQSRFGSLGAWTEPRLEPGAHPVAACLIAALRRELQTVWAG
jgi:aspartate dehydrogenase